jgi:tRNA(Ile2) C34 agmatinyltransferase TiaS
MDAHSGRCELPRRYILTCPSCAKRMKIASVVPVIFAPGAQEVAYRCEQCDVEISRTIKSVETSRAIES